MRASPEIPEDIEDCRDATWCREATRQVETVHDAERFIEDAGFASQGLSLSGNAALGFFEERREDLAAPTQRGELDAVRGPGKRALREGDLHRSVSRVLRRDLRHLLVHGDGVPVRRAEATSGQPHRDAVVVVAKRSRMMHPADRRDRLAMLL